MPNFELHFELEPNCILACKHCSSQAIKKEVLQFNREDVLRLVKALNPLEIYFTGGEPLLFRDLLPLFSEISSQFPECKLGLFTTGIVQNNGCLMPVGLDTLTELYRSGLRICYVSLYSDEENWHDFMTGTKGSFGKTVQAIKNMYAVGIDVRINLVVTRFSASRIRNIIEFVKDLKVSEVRLLKLIQHGNATVWWDTIGISDQEYLEVMMFKMNQPHCLYYEIHAFFIKENKEKGENVCFIAPDLDFRQVHNICEKKYPNRQIQYQIINSTFIDRYIKEELFKRLVSTFNSLAFNPEDYLFIKYCAGL